jgi:hypothetical protein
VNILIKNFGCILRRGERERERGGGGGGGNII